ncbi:MAG: helix-turn-helix transcriptional regulator [Candidatus Heimdallarchaeaceae archaeon]
MNRRIAIITIVFLVTLSVHEVAHSTSNTSPIADQLGLEQTKQTAISKVDLVINTYLLIGKINLTIEYIQLEENSTRFIDTVTIKGNLSDVYVKDTLDNNLLIGSSYNDILDATDITFQLQRALNVGEKYTVLIFSILPTKVVVQNRILDFSINWTQTVSVFSATVYLEKYLMLLSTSPTPQTTSVINQRIKMTWDTIMMDEFALLIEFKDSLEYEIITVSPTVWNIGNISRSSRTVKQKFVIVNLLNSPIRVDVINNNSWIDIERSFVVGPSSQKEIIAEMDISNTGQFEGVILFNTNMSLQEVPCEVSVYVEDSLNPWMLVGLILGIALLALGGLAFYLYNQMKPVEEVIEEKKSQEQIKNLKVDKLEGFLNENEIQVVKEVINKPGISQAQIVQNTGISKSTLSRIVAKMERKGLLKKKSVGMSHQLYIDKESSFLKYAKK